MKGFLGEQLYRLYKVILKLVLTIVPTVLMTITFFVQLAHFEFGLEGIFSQIIGLCIHNNFNSCAYHLIYLGNCCFLFAEDLLVSD